MNHKKARVVHTSLLVTGLSVLFCLAMLVAAGYLIFTRTQPVQVATEPVSLVTEGDIKIETLSQDSEKRQGGSDYVAEGGMLVFSINATPLMNNGASMAGLLVENPPGSGRHFTITVQRDNTKEIIYQSGYLDPEQYIDDVPLDMVLPRGEYPYTAYSDVCRIEDNVRMGGAETEIRPCILGQARMPSGHRAENREVRGNGDGGRSTNQREPG